MRHAKTKSIRERACGGGLGRRCAARTTRVGHRSVLSRITAFTAPDAPSPGGSPGRNPRKPNLPPSPHPKRL